MFEYFVNENVFLCIKMDVYTHFLSCLHSYEDKYCFLYLDISASTWHIQYIVIYIISSFMSLKKTFHEKTSNFTLKKKTLKSIFYQGRQLLPGQSTWFYLNSGRVGNCLHYCLFLLSFSKTEINSSVRLHALLKKIVLIFI